MSRYLSYYVWDQQRVEYCTKLQDAIFYAFVFAGGSGRSATLDVLELSRPGSDAWPAEEWVRVFNKDPNAAIVERYVVSVRRDL